MTTHTYNVDLKALRLNLYPNAENTQGLISAVETGIRDAFNHLRASTMELMNHSRISMYLIPGMREFADNTYPDLNLGLFDDEFFITTTVTNTVVERSGVTLVNAKIDISPITVDNPDAFRILNMLDISGTFAIEPTYRVTAY